MKNISLKLAILITDIFGFCSYAVWLCLCFAVRFTPFLRDCAWQELVYRPNMLSQQLLPWVLSIHISLNYMRYSYFLWSQLVLWEILLSCNLLGKDTVIFCELMSFFFLSFRDSLFRWIASVMSQQFYSPWGALHNTLSQLLKLEKRRLHHIFVRRLFK